MIIISLKGLYRSLTTIIATIINVASFLADAHSNLTDLFFKTLELFAFIDILMTWRILPMLLMQIQKVVIESIFLT